MMTTMPKPGSIPFTAAAVVKDWVNIALGEGKCEFRKGVRYEKGTIPHVQFNVVDSGVLREAQEHPEDYSDLQVRVAGYSAFWADLPNETQESIIARTEQCLA